MYFVSVLGAFGILSNTYLLCLIDFNLATTIWQIHRGYFCFVSEIYFVFTQATENILFIIYISLEIRAIPACSVDFSLSE